MIERIYISTGLTLSQALKNVYVHVYEGNEFKKNCEYLYIGC